MLRLQLLISKCIETMLDGKIHEFWFISLHISLLKFAKLEKIDSSHQSMAENVNPVDDIIGFDFFSILPDKIEEINESQSNIGEW